ncbi:MAG TPA: TonB family protein [Candidatus Angelobacter sp.]|nr:TonB family protein [Candidatus Angelobacter sp.]
MKFLLVTMLLFCFVQYDACAEELRSVTQEESAQHLLKNVDPVYPAMGKQLHIQGEVKLRIAISDTGAVRLLEIVSGSPILISSAVEAVQQRRYSPFVVDGHAVAVQTTVTVPFSLGDTPAQIKDKNARNDLYFKTIDSCRKQIAGRQFSPAEETCRKAVTLSEELDPARKLERLVAVREMGNLSFQQKKFSDALHYYEAELRIGETFLNSTDDDLAAAQYHVADALWGTGHMEEAHLQFEKAESGFKQAAANIDSAFIKNEYAKELKWTLRDHAAMLRQMGRAEEAGKLEKEAAAIVVKEGLHPED